jgi:hypothetical protein
MRPETVRRLLIPAVLALMLLLPSAALAAPANDDLANATPLELDQSDEPAGQTNVGATVQTNEPLTPAGAGFCRAGGFDSTTGVKISDTVWYVVTGDGDPVTLDTRGSAIDTVMAVYDGDSGDFLKCNDDIRASGTSPDRDSELTFPSVAGRNYFVQIGACSGDCVPGAETEGHLAFIAFSAPGNDTRARATTLTNSRPTPARTWGGTTDPGERLTCGDAPYSRTVWFHYRVPGNGSAVFSASGNFDTVMAVYRGTSFLACNDDASATVFGPSRLTMRVTPGDYYVQVGGYGTAPDADYGDFSATVDFTADPVPPADTDGDGVPDSSDKCPTQNASARDADRDGCLDPDPDSDHDGVLTPQDKCPTQDASGRDANHDGCLDPAPHKRISADAKLRATPTATGIRLVYLRVIAPKGSRIAIRCGTGCKIAKRASVEATAARTVSIKKLAGRAFRAGQKIRIYVTRKNRIGAYIEYKITRGGFKRINRCLNPGSSKPRKRCR